MKDLTKKQKVIYDTIKSFIEKKGYSPSIREIGTMTELRSPGTICVHLKRIKEKGYITYEKGKNRTIRIIKE